MFLEELPEALVGWLLRKDMVLIGRLSPVAMSKAYSGGPTCSGAGQEEVGGWLGWG